MTTTKVIVLVMTTLMMTILMMMMITTASVVVMLMRILCATRTPAFGRMASCKIVVRKDAKGTHVHQMPGL